MLLLAGFGGPVLAEDGAAAFQVTGHAVHAETENAELCLTFNAPLALHDRAALAAALQLEKNGARVAVAPRDLSLTPNELCAQRLEHRQSYRLTLKNLRSREGNALAAPVALKFNVPERKPSLAFAAIGDAAGMPLLIKNDKGAFETAALGVVRAVNVPTARLKLFRVADAEKFPAAWQQFAQVALAPSESLYFATQNATPVWEGLLAFGQMPDKAQDLTPPLPGDDILKPGLYFLAVMPDDAATPNPTMLAGRWFTVANLRLSAGVVEDGVRVFASDAATTRPLADVTLRATTAEGKILAEGKSGPDGAALLAVKTEQRAATALIIGATANGDAAFLPIKPQGAMAVPPAPRDATLVADRERYQAGSVATVTLWARDAQGRSEKIANSSLKLVRPDQVFYSEQPVPADQSGPLFLTVPLPVTRLAGDWLLLWQQADGQVLARATLRVAPDADDVKLEITADREAPDAEGRRAVTVRATNAQGQPVAWRSGDIADKATRPEFAAWKGYVFGVAPAPDAAAQPTARFITGADGAARIKLRWPAESGTQATQVTARLDNTPVAASASLTARTEGGWVGVKPASGLFNENSEASFDLIALDANGKRRSRGDLYFQVYEEGRSFKWFQESGHWDYRPLPQHRRIGGGKLALAATGDNRVVWPVTAGHYVLEIADENGAVLTQYAFAAGGAPPLSPPAADERLTLTPPDSLTAGQPQIVTLNLAQPAMVAAIIGEGKNAQVLHRFMPAGLNRIDVTPPATWGAAAPLWINASFADGRSAHAATVLRVTRPQRELTLETTAPTAIVGGHVLSLPVTAQNTGNAPLYVAAVATPQENTGNATRASIVQTTIKADDKGHATLSLPVPEYSGTLQVTLLAWNDTQATQRRLTVKVDPVLDVSAAPPAQLATGDKSAFTITLSNRSGAEGAYAYTLSAADGLKLDGPVKGSVKLKRGESSVLRFALTAREASHDALRLEIVGPEHFRLSRVWPVDVRGGQDSLPATQAARLESQQTLALPLPSRNATAKKKSASPVAALVSPMPLLDAPQALAVALATEPFTTAALAAWIETTRQWQAPIIALGFNREENLARARAAALDQLRQRQNYDGGFSALSGDAASDLASTVAALRALKDEAPQAAAQAAQWLRHYTDNTWFDESERPLRAAAFLAQTLGGKVDSSALRYFADTSRDKNLPPRAAAELAQALAENRDDEAARFWLEQARNALPEQIKDRTGDAWETLAALAGNPLLPPRDIAAMAEDAARTDLALSPVAAAARLRLVETLARRAGVWHLGVNGPVRNLTGLYAVSLREKSAPSALRMAANETAYVLQTETGGDAAPPAKAGAALTAQRKLFRLDGTPVGVKDRLASGQTYLLVLQGQDKSRETGDRIIVAPLNAGMELMPLGNADASAFAAAWPWLPPLTAWRGVMASPTALSLTLPIAEEWRVAALVRAGRKGTYVLPPLTAQDAGGATIKTASPPLPLQVE